MMKASASLKKQSPLSPELPIVALTKKLMQIIYADKLPTPAEGPATMTRNVVQVLEYPFLPPPALAGGSQLTRSRILEKILCQMLQDAAGLREGPIARCTSKKKENEKYSLFTWQVLVCTLRNNFGAP